MIYNSTRGARIGARSAEAIKTGLCPDGGLFMPERIPTLNDGEIRRLSALSYHERAAAILGKFLTDYTEEELLADAGAAYAEDKFGREPAPISALSDNRFLLELYHGPTCAFKDMALQIMPRLFARALKKTNEKRTALILVATSGDTGKAALEGYRDVPGTAIQVFYPADGVSRTQKLQMQTQGGENVSVYGIRGNFDDAQNGVKRIFADEKTREALDRNGVFLSSANSINWGRLVPQIVYYVSACCDLLARGAIAPGEAIDVCVPTGNFGNIFAAFLAKKMGLPIGRLVCASNENNVLTEFLETGVYDRNRPFRTTMSPSMDILISSNLERLLYVVCGPEKTARCMAALAKEGRYRVSPEAFREIGRHFAGYCASEEETADVLRRTYEKDSRLVDPHTAVALAAAEKYREKEKSPRALLVASTASPYKFAGDVYRSLTGVAAEESSLPAVLAGLTGEPVPAPIAALGERAVRFSEVIGKEQMDQAVRKFAENR